MRTQTRFAVESLEGRVALAVESSPYALLGAAAQVAQAVDAGLDAIVNYPGPASPFDSPYAAGPACDPSTAGPLPSPAAAEAALAALYTAGGPLPFYALPYPTPESDTSDLPPGMPSFAPDFE